MRTCKPVVALAAILLFWAAAPGRAADFAADYARLKKAGDEARQRGAWAEAAKQFDAAWRLAAEQKKTKEQAEAALAAALSLRALIAQDPAQAAKRRPELETYYGDVIAHGLPRDKELACNNLGFLHLRGRDYKKALAIFQKVVEPANTDSYVYHYNWARALEGNGDRDRAADHYWKALDKNPRMTPAAERLRGLLLTDERHRYDRATRLLDLLLKEGEAQDGEAQAAWAGASVHAFLKAWGNEAEAEALFPRWLKYYLVARVSPVEFQKREEPALKEIEKIASCAGLVGELRRLYRGELAAKGRPPFFADRAEVERVLPRWGEVLSRSPGSAKVLSRLLSRLGDVYYRLSLPDVSGQTKPAAADLLLDAPAAARYALARYSAAYALDPGNGDAAVYAVATLSEHHKGLDADGALLEKLRRGIFDNKISLYGEPPTRDNLRALFRCHVILAGIAEKQAKWGPASDPKSALFQLTHAQRVEQRLRERFDKDVPPSTWIDASLGNAYARAAPPNPRQAAESYVRAAEGYVRTHNPVEASTAAAAAKKVIGANAADWGRLREDADRFGLLAANLDKVRVEEDVPQGGAVAAAFFVKNEKLLWESKAGRDGEVFLWTLGSAEKPSRVLMKWPAQLLALAPDRKTFACASPAGSEAEVWTVEGRPTVTLAGHSGPVTAVTFAPDGKTLATASRDGTVKTWDVASSRQVRSLSAAKQAVNCTAYSPDGKWLASDSGKDVVLWDLAGGVRKASLEGHDGPVTAVQFDPAGKLVASGSADHTVRLWESPSGKPRATLSSHRAGVTAVAFSPDGALLVSGGADGAAIVWSVARQKELAWLAPFRGRVTSVSFSPDGKKVLVGLVLGYGRGDLKVWDVSQLAK